MRELLSLIFSVLTSFFIYAFGEFDIILQTLIMFMIADYITGIIASIKCKYRKKLSSKIGFIGILRKILMLVIISIAYRLDITFEIDILRYLTIMFYIGNEGLSIIENLACTGVPMPKIIINYLEQIEKGSHKYDNSNKKS